MNIARKFLEWIDLNLDLSIDKTNHRKNLILTVRFNHHNISLWCSLLLVFPIMQDKDLNQRIPMEIEVLKATKMIFQVVLSKKFWTISLITNSSKMLKWKFFMWGCAIITVKQMLIKFGMIWCLSWRSDFR